MRGLLAQSRGIDAINHFIGYHIRWPIMAAVVVSAANAIVRKLFDTSGGAFAQHPN